MIEGLRSLVGSNKKILYEGKPNKNVIYLKVFFVILFMLIHMMPVWIYLVGIIFTTRKYKNTSYIVTDRAIYVSGGIFTENINVKPFAELSPNGKSVFMIISSISNYIDVYNMINKLQTDIYTDVMYPNAKRPSDNPGYNTKYKGL